MDGLSQRGSLGSDLSSRNSIGSPLRREYQCCTLDGGGTPSQLCPYDRNGSDQERMCGRKGTGENATTINYSAPTVPLFRTLHVQISVLERERQEDSDVCVPG